MLKQANKTPEINQLHPFSMTCFVLIGIFVSQSLAEESPEHLCVKLSEIENGEAVIIGKLGLPVGSVVRVRISRSSKRGLKICRANHKVVDVDLDATLDIGSASSAGQSHVQVPLKPA